MHDCSSAFQYGRSLLAVSLGGVTDVHKYTKVYLYKYAVAFEVFQQYAEKNTLRKMC